MSNTPLEQLQYAEEKLNSAVNALGSTLDIVALRNTSNDLRVRLYHTRMFRFVLECYTDIKRIDYVIEKDVYARFTDIVLTDSNGDVFVDNSKFYEVFVKTLNVLVAKYLSDVLTEGTIKLEELVEGS